MTLFASKLNIAATTTTKWNTVTENFPGTSLGAFWVNTSGTFTVANNKVALSTGTFTGLWSAARDLTDSFILLRAEPPTGGTLQLGIDIGVAFQSTNAITMWKQGTLLHFYVVTAGSPSDVTVTYDPVAHAWWRVRQSTATNQVFYETSPDGLAWTVRRTITTPPFASGLTNAQLKLWSGDTTGVQDAYFSKLNIPPGSEGGGAGNPAWSSITDDFAGSSLAAARWVSSTGAVVAGNRLGLTPTQGTITYPGSGSQAATGGTPNLTLNVPAGSAGDFAYIAVEDASGLADGFDVPGATLLGGASPTVSGGLAGLYRLPIAGAGGVALPIAVTRPSGGGSGGGSPAVPGAALATIQSSSANSIAVQVPAHSAGDLLVIQATINNVGGLVDIPAGWLSPSAVTEHANAFESTRILYQIAPTTTTGTTTQTVTFNSFYKGTAVCQVVQNPHPTTPIAGYSVRPSASSGESPVVANSVTTTTDGTRRLLFGAYNVTGTPVAIGGFTQKAVATGVLGTDTQSVVYAENADQASAGATGNVNMGNGAFTAWLAIQLIINPAGAPAANWADLSATCLRVTGLDPLQPNGAVSAPDVVVGGTQVTHPSHVVAAGNTSLLVSAVMSEAATWTGPGAWTERADALGKAFRTQLIASTATVSGQVTTPTVTAPSKFGWAMELRVVASAAAQALSNPYDLTNSFTAVQADPPSGAQPLLFELRDHTNTVQRAAWRKANANTLSAELDPGSGTTTVDVPYDATAMRWWRIRHESNSLFWETSPDSQTWTVRRSAAASFPVTALEARFQAPSGSGSGTGYFSKLNLVVVPVPPVDPFPPQPSGAPIGSHEGIIDNGMLMRTGVATGGANPPVVQPGATGLFEVRGARIYDPLGVKFIPVGTSLMGPNAFWNDNPVSLAATLQNSWKFNLVRIVTCLPGGCACCTGQTTTAANDLNAIVQAYTSRRMVVLIDYHQSLEGATITGGTLTAATTFWQTQAAAYKTNPYVWFNLVNGPEQGAGAPGRWLTFNQALVNAIRATGAPNVIVTDDSNFGAGAANLWSIANVATGESGVIDQGASLTDSENRIVYAVQMDNVWGPPSNLAGSVLYTDTQRNARLRDYLTRATAGGRPVLIDYVGFMAEDQETTGTSWECRTNQLTPCPSTGSGTRLAAKAAYAVASEFDVGIVAWAGFPLYTTNWDATQAQLTTFGQWHRGYAAAYATQVGQTPTTPGGGGGGGGTITPTGQFEAQSKRIYDPLGVEFVPMGTNLAGPNTFWVDNPAVLAATLQTDWGFNAIRLFTCLSNGCDCCRNTAPVWTNANDLNAIVNAYTSRKMVVMIDYHQLDFGAVASQADLTAAETFWTQQANLWKNNPYVWFEPFNEPEAGSGAPDRWLVQHQRIVNAIRGAGAPNLIVVNDSWVGQGTGVWWDINPVPVGYSGILDKGDQLIDPLNRIAYDLHPYDAWGFPSTGDGATRFTDLQRETKLQNYIDRATASGRPLLFGEFGFYDWESETTGASYHCSISGPCPNTGSAQRLAVKAMVSIGVRNHSGMFMWNGYPASDSGTPNGRGWDVTQRTTLGDMVFDYVTRMRAALAGGGTPGGGTGGGGTTGAFSLAGSIIRDPEGKNFLPMGVNATGADSYVWDSAFDPTGKAAVWKGLGYNAIRHVNCVTCASHAPGSRHYGSIDALIAEYTALKMVVIIDNHEGILGASGGKTQAEVDAAIAYFTPLAAQYKNNPYVWFEPFNEPEEEGYPGVAAPAHWQTYTEAVVAAIRAQGNNNICVLNSSHYGQDRAGSGALVPAQSAILTYGPGILSRRGNVVFDLHVYSRYGANAGVSDANMVAQFALYRAAGLAVLVGETGGYADDFLGSVVPGNRQGTEALFRVRPPDVGILPWMVGNFFTPGGGTVNDPSSLHAAWRAAPPNFSDGTPATPGGSGTDPDPDPGGGGGGTPGGTGVCANAPSSSQVGPAVSSFTTINSQASLSAAGLPGTWNSSVQQWNCTSCPAGGFHGLRVLGAVYYTGSAPLVMEDCIVSNSGSSFAIVFCASGAGAPRLRRCKLERPVQQPITYGAGVVEWNGQSDGWVEFCDLSGNADGIQLSGDRNRIYRNVIHNLVVRDSPSATHNDGIQVFSGTGTVIMENTFDIGAFANHSNGCIFTQGGSIGAINITGNSFTGGGYQINAQNGQLSITNNCFRQPRLFGAMAIVGSASVVANSGNTGT